MSVQIADRTWSVYELRDPRTQAVRYVGWAFNVAKRLADHIYKARSETTHKARWINQLVALGLSPIATVVETGSGSWSESERAWIARHRAAGADLTNATRGGEGVVGLVFSAESREKLSAAKRGRRQTAEHIEKAHAPLRGRKRPEHVRKALIASRTGKPRSEATKEKLRIACSGWRHTEEARAAMSAARTGRVMSDATRAKISATKRAKRAAMSREASS